MSSRPRGCMNSCQQKQAKGASPMSNGMTGQGCAHCTHPLWPDKQPPGAPPDPRSSEPGRKIFKQSPQVMSTPQPQRMNRYKTIHAQHNQPERRPE